jgi:hypothetical protein
MERMDGQQIAVGSRARAEQVLLRHLHLPIAVYAVPPWQPARVPKEHMVPQSPLLAQPPRPRVPIAPGHTMGLVANVGAANTIVHRDLLIALAQRWSSKLASSSVESRKVDREGMG